MGHYPQVHMFIILPAGSSAQGMIMSSAQGMTMSSAQGMTMSVTVCQSLI